MGRQLNPQRLHAPMTNKYSASAGGCASLKRLGTKTSLATSKTPRRRMRRAQRTRGPTLTATTRWMTISKRERRSRHSSVYAISCSAPNRQAARTRGKDINPSRQHPSSPKTMHLRLRLTFLRTSPLAASIDLILSSPKRKYSKLADPSPLMKC